MDAADVGGPGTDVDVVVIGAGVSGMYQLYKLRELGLSTLVIEAGSDVGGTWYWNRYPGARFDSESYSYIYSFSQELLEEWNWSEHFSAQPETLRYLNHVADKFDLRTDIRFDTRVAAAAWEEADHTWTVTTDDGAATRCRFLITAVGGLSVPVMPLIEGIDDFAGEAFHTALWPHEPVSFEGKRVGVIGTGATGVQVIQEVAKTAEALTVFQRSPNWCAPLNNAPIDDETQAEIKASYQAIFDRCNASNGGFLHQAREETTLDVSEEDRLAFWEELYNAPGFGIWFGNYRDVLVSPEANALMSDFIAGKIRERVDDPALAEKLIPRNHGFGTRRVPMETNYYEAYNQPNVHLVDISECPIQRMTPTGIETADGHHELDLVIYATGFDAVTGALDRLDISGAAGQKLADTWDPEPRTFLGLAVPGFPNLFTIIGPHNVATFCNMPRCIEQNVDWVTQAIADLLEAGCDRIEANDDSADLWTEHVHEGVAKLLMSKVDSWFNGYNSNLPGKERRVLVYAGGLPTYREWCEESAANDYAGFVVT